MFNIIPLKNGLENVGGFYFDGVNSGFKKQGNDLGFIRCDAPYDVSAVFTTNRFAAAPIRHFLRYGENFKTNFILLNSKNANSMTGANGIADIDEIFTKISSKISHTNQISDSNFKLINPIMSSTGVIGYRLKKDKILAGFEKFNLNSRNSNGVATAIMTTDTFKKELAFRVECDDGVSFTIAAICKGAGMINPALATMLCYILTDANIPKSDMDELLKSAIKFSFNAVSVDGDTSTNDSVMMLTSRLGGYEKTAFSFALNRICKELALMLVRDGEGANKLVAFEVKGAKDDAQAQKAAKALSNSPLVKTAIYGEDPNWGRIASTIGASGVECCEENLVIYYDDVLVYDAQNTELTPQREAAAHAVMAQDSYKISCDLGVGSGEFCAYGCDLSYDYVKINADYRS